MHPDDLAAALELLGLAIDDDLPPPSYNIAPTQRAAVITQGRAPRMTALTWGWRHHTRSGAERLIINARSEDLHEYSWTFTDALQHARCLVPANGYYEWKALADAKQPWFFTRAGTAPFCFAGLVQDGAFVILTASPTDAALRDVHDRAPCIIRPEHYATWLDPSFKGVNAVPKVPKAFSSQEFEIDAWGVSKRVGSPRNDTPDLLDPVEPDRGIFDAL